LIVEDDILDKAIDVIMKSAYTGKIGDGKIFLYKVENAIRIRSGEWGVAAI
jgi:nitrogen regulatory protein PII